MADNNFTQVQDHAETETKPYRTMMPASVMHELWRAASEGRQLSRDQIQWISGADDMGTMMLRQLQNVLSGVGITILSNSRDEGMRSEAFESPRNVADLLFVAEYLIDAATGMIEIGVEATSRRTASTS